jgi:Arc/MetJ-type ribon-helix-helix transcriptional regulator
VERESTSVRELVREGTDMTEEGRSADDVLQHSEDEGEWEQEPEQIESRPSGSQVISARLPTALAEQVLALATQRGVKPSEVVREAIELWLRGTTGGVVEISAYAGQNMRVMTPSTQRRTENFNLVVEVETDPDRIEVLEAAIS